MQNATINVLVDLWRSISAVFRRCKELRQGCLNRGFLWGWVPFGVLEGFQFGEIRSWHLCSPNQTDRTRKYHLQNQMLFIYCGGIDLSTWICQQKYRQAWEVATITIIKLFLSIKIVIAMDAPRYFRFRPFDRSIWNSHFTVIFSLCARLNCGSSHSQFDVRFSWLYWTFDCVSDAHSDHIRSRITQSGGALRWQGMYYHVVRHVLCNPRYFSWGAIIV